MRSVRKRSAIAAAWLCLLLTPALAEDDAYWINPLGGFFHDAVNWEDGFLPGVPDNAYFNLDATYPVTLTNDVEHYLLHIGDGDVTFNLNGHTYEASYRIQVAWGNGEEASVTITNGTLITEQAKVGDAPTVGNYSAGSLTISGPNTVWTNTGTTDRSIDLGLRRAPGKLYITDGAKVTMLGGLEMDIGVDDKGRDSELLVSGQDTILNAAGPFVLNRTEGTFRVESGANVTINSYLSIAKEAVIDNATITTTTWRLGIPTGANSILTLNNNAVYNLTSVAGSRIGYNSDGTVIVRSGSRVDAAGEIRLGWGATAGIKGTLLVHDRGEVDTPEIRLGHGSSVSYADLLVHTGGVVRVHDSIHQNYLATCNNIGVIEVAGDDPGSGGQARLEVNNFYLGTGDGGTAARGGIALTVADGGAVAVDNLLRIGSTSSMTIDRGAVSAATLDMRVDGDGTSKLTAILRAGGTDTMIAVSGAATVEEAEFELTLAEGFGSEQGEIFTIIESGTLTGRFDGIEENQIISVGDYYKFRASYQNNSFTLTTLPPPGTVVTVF